MKRYALLFAAVLFLFSAGHAFAARFYLVPAGGNYKSGSRFTAQLMMDTGGQAVNAAEGTLSFSTRYLQVDSISTAGSVFKFWSQDPAFSNSSGNITFGGGLPSPGVSSPSAKILSVTFRAVGDGRATVHVESGGILANDGIGTNILTSSQDGNYDINADSSEPAPVPDATDAEPAPAGSAVPGKLAVSSRTHPDESTWYNLPTLDLSWELPQGVTGVSYAFVDAARYDLSNTSKGLVSGTSYDLTKFDDGTWYFFIKAKNANGWGAVTRRMAKIDRTAPEAFSLVKQASEDATDPAPVFKWNTSDKASGISGYKVKIGDGDWFELKDISRVADTYTLPVQAPGTKEFTVRAYDFAGNMTEARTTFTVEPLAMPEITDYPKELNSPLDPLVVAGSALASSKVELSLVNGSKTIIIATRADKNGRWLIESHDRIPGGAWELRARTVDERGATSLFSPPVSMRVSNWFGRILALIFQWGGLAFLILLLILGIIAAAIYIVHRIRMWRLAMKQELRQFRNELERDLRDLEADIENIGERAGKVNARSGAAKKGKTNIRQKVKRVKADLDEEIRRLDRMG
jgi:type II secretory pathway component PulM